MSEDYISKLGAEQKRIFSRMVNGENIFLTGNAGTGKSFLVKAFDQYCKQNDVKILKAAPTGIAACNIQGVTLHRLFKLKTDVKSMLADVRNVPAEVMQILNLASVLLIDEISMVRIDVFDKVMKYIDLINRERKAQGQTYDAMNFKPEIFQDGQLYVALSRCKAADKMFIADPLTPKMVRVSSEVVNYYKNPENYTFFGREKDIISVQTSRDCEGAVKLLNEVFADNKAEILDFLQGLSAKKETEKSEKAATEKSKVSVAGWNKKGA